MKIDYLKLKKIIEGFVADKAEEHGKKWKDRAKAAELEAKRATALKAEAVTKVGGLKTEVARLATVAKEEISKRREIQVVANALTKELAGENGTIVINGEKLTFLIDKITKNFVDKPDLKLPAREIEIKDILLAAAKGEDE